MRARTASVTLLTAAVLAVAPLTAVAADTTVSGPGATTSVNAKAQAAAKAAGKAAAKAEARSLARTLERVARGNAAVVLGGVAGAVPVAVSTEGASTLTFTVRGGRFKELRGKAVSITVAADAKVSGVQSLAQVAPGDHVVVKMRRVDVTVTSASATTDAVLSVLAAVTRVVVSHPGTDAEAASETSIETDSPTG